MKEGGGDPPSRFIFHSIINSMSVICLGGGGWDFPLTCSPPPLKTAIKNSAQYSNVKY